MANAKLGFEDFISTVELNSVDFIKEIHEEFEKHGCKLEVKEAKSGLVVSYLLNKKTILNYVFRKKGMLVRIYANQLGEYLPFLDTLPDSMAAAIKDAPVCKRLVNPGACNSKCAMGYAFPLQGEQYQKCRYSAFQFLICEQNNPYIKTFLMNELNAGA